MRGYQRSFPPGSLRKRFTILSLIVGGDIVHAEDGGDDDITAPCLQLQNSTAIRSVWDIARRVCAGAPRGGLNVLRRYAKGRRDSRCDKLISSPLDMTRHSFITRRVRLLPLTGTELLRVTLLCAHSLRASFLHFSQCRLTLRMSGLDSSIRLEILPSNFSACPGPRQRSAPH